MFLTMDPHQHVLQIKVQSAEQVRLSYKGSCPKGLKKLVTDPHDLARPSLANYVSEMLGYNNTSNGSNSGFNSH